MAGLKICTRWRANSARRRRRISSSLLPENIGPTTTSIQPILPLTMSTGLFSSAIKLTQAPPQVCGADPQKKFDAQIDWGMIFLQQCKEIRHGQQYFDPRRNCWRAYKCNQSVP